MTRKELSQIYWLNRECKMWKEKLMQLQMSRGSAPQQFGDGIHASGISDKTGNEAVAIAETEKVIEGFLARIQIARRDIYRHIVTIEDSQLRQIVQFRCVDLMTWREVGNAVGITADSARMMYNRAYPKE